MLEKVVMCVGHTKNIWHPKRKEFMIFLGLVFYPLNKTRLVVSYNQWQILGTLVVVLNLRQKKYWISFSSPPLQCCNILGQGCVYSCIRDKSVSCFWCWNELWLWLKAIHKVHQVGNKRPLLILYRKWTVIVKSALCGDKERQLIHFKLGIWEQKLSRSVVGIVWDFAWRLCF